MVEVDLPGELAGLRTDDAFVAVAAGCTDPQLPVRALLDAALDAPVASAPLEALVRPGDRVTVIVSDATRDEPRADLLDAVRARLGRVRLTVAVATGTHGPCAIDRLGIPAALLAGAELVMHDGHRAENLVDVGQTRRGTPVRVHRCAVEADLVVATGAIRPHYFAGFGAGAKAIFPGLGGAREIRINHRLKQEAGARAGVVDGNPCREDLEEAVGLVQTRSFLLDLVCDPDEVPRAAVAGDVVRGFRAGADRARPWFQVRAPRARTIVVSDRPPVTSSLYQASKLIAAVAPLLEEDGTIVLVADCRDGIGPLEVVNQAIYEIGLRPRLPARHRILLVSSLDAATVAPSYATWCASVSSALETCAKPIVVVPRGGHILLEST